ncbi:MAG: hypothetical protein LBH98_06405 [Chitinispirillales bacterium]|jgi:hypothetical protein|nr:hypothetical protein [Chitinispirillales bacterium]
MKKALFLILALLIFSCTDTGNVKEPDNPIDSINQNHQIIELIRAISGSTTEKIKKELNMSFIRHVSRENGSNYDVYRNEKGLLLKVFEDTDFLKISMDVEYWKNKNNVNNYVQQFIWSYWDDTWNTQERFPETKNEFINIFAQNIDQAEFEILRSYGTEGVFMVLSLGETIYSAMLLQNLIVLCEEEMMEQPDEFANVSECVQYYESEDQLLLFNSVEDMANFVYMDKTIRFYRPQSNGNPELTPKEAIEYFSTTNIIYRVFTDIDLYITDDGIANSWSIWLYEAKTKTESNIRIRGGL